MISTLLYATFAVRTNYFVRLLMPVGAHYMAIFPMRLLMPEHCAQAFLITNNALPINYWTSPWFAVSPSTAQTDLLSA